MDNNNFGQVIRSIPPDEEIWGLQSTPAPNGYTWTIYYVGFDGDVPDPGTEGGLHFNSSTNSSACPPLMGWQRCVETKSALFSTIACSLSYTASTRNTCFLSVVACIMMDESNGTLSACVLKCQVRPDRLLMRSRPISRPAAVVTRVDAQTLTNGTTSPLSCAQEGCVDGVVLRGNFTHFSVPDDNCTTGSTNLNWNALASEVKAAIEECSNDTRQVRGT